jgi:hypothetical protein
MFKMGDFPAGHTAVTPTHANMVTNNFGEFSLLWPFLRPLSNTLERSFRMFSIGRAAVCAYCNVLSLPSKTHISVSHPCKSQPCPI